MKVYLMARQNRNQKSSLSFRAKRGISSCGKYFAEILRSAQDDLAGFLIALRPGILALCLLILPACRPGGSASNNNGQIYVTTSPAEATLLCDSANQGPTPTTISVPPGKHLLIVRKQGYREARATVNIKPAECMAVELKLEPWQGLALVNSRPAGAEVELDGANIGRTPLFKTDFPLGRKRLLFSLPGFAPKSVDVNIEDRTPLKVDVSLSPDAAELELNSSPTGATVVLDGSNVGRTPAALPNVKPGRHVLELSLKGHAISRHEIALQSGDRRKIDSTLKPLPGKITISSTPPDARIFLNSQFKALTPINSMEIPSGKYEIRAELKGYDPQFKTNTVTFGEETAVDFKLVKSSGTILVSTMPPGVNVYLDGEPCGLTKARGNEPISEQLQMDFVPKGRHILQLARRDYHEIQRTLDIAPKQTIIVHEKLVLRAVPFVPNAVLRTGDAPEQTYRGVVREKYANGDVKMEVERGIFRTFSKSEIVSLENIPSAGEKQGP